MGSQRMLTLALSAPPACLPQVYIFGRGNVKPADKRYSRVRNDYALHFDPATFELESCGEDKAGRFC